MNVPNAEQAVVDIRHIENYCLNHQHPRGKHKARVFLSALGLNRTDAPELADILRQKILTEKCTVGEIDQYGRRYLVDFLYVRGSKKAMIRSTWIIKTGETIPYLTSCCVL
ncbi:DUF6883 domain-containing protein [Thiorhodospira sibirica]|uniref:DUF6883 domain-containing protein n=1 Tax=Thiorhodospira sibirica TaxID=154347 RepID=UPI001111E072|nr:DUF6883 domain-containing protein [Thiorhodospira sibirica]